MDPRFARLPADLARRTRWVRLGRSGVPALLAHPDWETPAPFVIWLHGRTVNKELDPGRYLRWVRAGIGAVAIDLPGHGERLDPAYHSPAKTLDMLTQVVGEIDEVLDALAAPEYGEVFDQERPAIGGMSAGGMATLRRLCDPHPFVCAAVEGTTGDLGALYAGSPERPWPVTHDPARVAAVDPARHLDGFRPIPLLALHATGDQMVPIAGMQGFLEALRERYRHQGADPAMIELRTFTDTGAPQEHAGFGRYGNDAKNAQVEFLVRHLCPAPPAAG